MAFRVDAATSFSNKFGTPSGQVTSKRPPGSLHDPRKVKRQRTQSPPPEAIPGLCNHVVVLILKELSGRTLFRIQTVNSEWRRLIHFVQIDHIRTLSLDGRLKELFHFFFPPPPTDNANPSEIASYIKDSIYGTVRCLLEELPNNLSDPIDDEMPDAQPMSFDSLSVDSQMSDQAEVVSVKSRSVFEIVEDIEQLATLLSACEQYSLLQLFSNKRNEAPKLSGKLYERIQIIEEDLRGRKLEELNGRYNNSLCIPREVLNSTSIQHLDLSNMKLSRIPPTINRLVNLIVLNLGSNQLLCIPEGVVELEQLRALNLSTNRLTHIPILPKNLEILDLSHNPLEQLSFLGTAVNLRRLSLCYTNLETFPLELATLPHVETLCVANNPLSKCTIRDLPNLKKMTVTNFPKENISEEIKRLSSIKATVDQKRAKDAVIRKGGEIHTLEMERSSFVSPTSEFCCYFSFILNDSPPRLEKNEQKGSFAALHELILDKQLFDILPQEVINRPNLDMTYMFLKGGLYS